MSVLTVSELNSETSVSCDNIGPGTDSNYIITLVVCIDYLLLVFIIYSKYVWLNKVNDSVFRNSLYVLISILGTLYTFSQC